MEVQNLRVFVKNMRGESLMPTSNRKARLLLKQKKARIFLYNPFTIQLLYATGEATQECNIGVDTGAKHIGIAITSQDKVMYNGEIELCEDVKSNIDTKRILRRSRRSRKTRYRQARFLNRKKSEKWLPPSLQSRIDNTFMWIDKFVNLVPKPILHIEVGKFDIAKMINPDIEGKDYQNGTTKGYYNIRYYVFARDNYTCQCCGKKNKIFHTHHIIYKSNGGTNRPDNLITVCEDCHTSDNHKKGGILYTWQEQHKKVKQYKEPPFMNSLRIRGYQKYPESDITYGNTTSADRKELGLSKTHYNDAITISNIESIKENPNDYILIKQYLFL